MPVPGAAATNTAATGGDTVDAADVVHVPALGASALDLDVRAAQSCGAPERTGDRAGPPTEPAPLTPPPASPNDSRVHVSGGVGPSAARWPHVPFARMGQRPATCGDLLSASDCMRVQTELAALRAPLWPHGSPRGAGTAAGVAQLEEEAEGEAAAASGAGSARLAVPLGAHVVVEVQGVEDVSLLSDQPRMHAVRAVRWRGGGARTAGMLAASRIPPLLCNRSPPPPATTGRDRGRRCSCGASALPD